MYLAFKHSHLLTALLSVSLTMIWSALAWRGSGAGNGVLKGKARLIYLIHRIVAGLAGLTGLGVTLAGPWRSMLFPYVGLAAFVIHGIAAGISRRSFGDQEKAGIRQLALIVQLIALLLSAYVMTVKPAWLLAWPQQT